MSITRIHDSIYRIAAPYANGGVVFLYLFRGDQIALVDTGTPEAVDGSIGPALAQIGMALADVDLILTTHPHQDHAGGNLALKRASNATIAMHAADLPMAKSVEALREFHLAPMRALDFPQSYIQERADYFAGAMEETNVPVDRILREGDILDLGRGVRLAVLHTPGHTPGSISFYWEGEGVLITGDAVQGMGPRAGGLPYYSDVLQYRRSLEKMLRLDPRMLCTGHACLGGGVVNDPTRIGDGCAPMLNASLGVVDTIHAAVRQAMQSRQGAPYREVVADAVAEMAYSIPLLLVRETGLPVFAPRTLLAHIEAIEAGA